MLSRYCGRQFPFGCIRERVGTFISSGSGLEQHTRVFQQPLDASPYSNVGVWSVYYYCSCPYCMEVKYEGTLGYVEQSQSPGINRLSSSVVAPTSGMVQAVHSTTQERGSMRTLPTPLSQSALPALHLETEARRSVGFRRLRLNDRHLQKRPTSPWWRSLPPSGVRAGRHRWTWAPCTAHCSRKGAPCVLSLENGRVSVSRDCQVCMGSRLQTQMGPVFCHEYYDVGDEVDRGLPGGSRLCCVLNEKTLVETTS